MRMMTGLSQSKFADLFELPVVTLKDWEIGRRTPPSYVLNMIQNILQYKGIYDAVSDEDYPVDT